MEYYYDEIKNKVINKKTKEEYIIGREINIGENIYTFSIYYKKNGVASVYIRRKIKNKTSKINKTNVINEIRKLPNEKIILINNYIKSLE